MTPVLLKPALGLVGSSASVSRKKDSKVSKNQAAVSVGRDAVDGCFAADRACFCRRVEG
jgi:hypothetical protein